MYWNQKHYLPSLRGMMLLSVLIAALQAGLEESAAYKQHIEATTNILTASRRAKVYRLLMVGGAGSLKVAPDLDLVDSTQFPRSGKPWR